MIIRYFIKGEEVDRQAAITRWHRSQTYLKANPRTRGVIFMNAERGIDTDGVTAHLAEAGITVTSEQSP